MKLALLLFSFITILTSCDRKLYGVYESSAKDKSALLRINLKQNNLVEKTEIHTIRIEQKGTWTIVDGKVVCFFNENPEGFPKDTLNLTVRGKKLFIYKNGSTNKKHYLKKI